MESPAFVNLFHVLDTLSNYTVMMFAYPRVSSQIQLERVWCWWDMKDSPINGSIDSPLGGLPIFLLAVSASYSVYIFICVFLVGIDTVLVDIEETDVFFNCNSNTAMFRGKMRFHNHFYGFTTMFIILVAIQEWIAHT